MFCHSDACNDRLERAMNTFSKEMNLIIHFAEMCRNAYLIFYTFNFPFIRLKRIKYKLSILKFYFIIYSWFPKTLLGAVLFYLCNRLKMRIRKYEMVKENIF